MLKNGVILVRGVVYSSAPEDGLAKCVDFICGLLSLCLVWPKIGYECTAKTKTVREGTTSFLVYIKSIYTFMFFMMSPMPWMINSNRFDGFNRNTSIFTAFLDLQLRIILPLSKPYRSHSSYVDL